MTWPHITFPLDTVGRGVGKKTIFGYRSGDFSRTLKSKVFSSKKGLGPKSVLQKIKMSQSFSVTSIQFGMLCDVIDRYDSMILCGLFVRFYTLFLGLEAFHMNF